jgi:TolB protein
MGQLYAPEISPDGGSIVFTNAGGPNSAIWIMNRDGSNPREVYRNPGTDALDPTWSPDGRQILFAMGSSVETKKLYGIQTDGTGLWEVNDVFSTRGRSDWSWSGEWIAGYSGGPWQRRIYLMHSDGSGLTELYSSGNVQAPSFSLDDQWVVFTGYLDRMGDDNGCELYLLGIYSGALRQLTENDFCDWQPRWGP